ncbi:MAG TPA: hypothetical protein ENN22_06645 [bacterium]|nr:hypothetical protein [bacterium]HDP98845.1 hypothetical protein [bacterium]
MKKKKQHDCVDLKNKIQKTLYKEYKKLTDEERVCLINRKLVSSDSPIAAFWRQNVLRVAEEKADYKSKKNKRDMQKSD